MTDTTLTVNVGQHYLNRYSEKGGEDNSDRITPPGNTWLVVDDDGQGSVRVLCNKTGGEVLLDKRRVQTDFKRQPRVFEEGGFYTVVDHSSMADVVHGVTPVLAHMVYSSVGECLFSDLRRRAKDFLNATDGRGNRLTFGDLHLETQWLLVGRLFGINKDFADLPRAAQLHYLTL